MRSGCIRENVGPSIFGACFVREIVTLFSSVMPRIAFIKGTYYAFLFVLLSFSVYIVYIGCAGKKY